jgi:hypothetical protein
MFVHDRQFFTVDPARSLYNVMSSYASIMLANSLLTVINAGIFMLLMYALIGARPFPPDLPAAPPPVPRMHAGPVHRLDNGQPSTCSHRRCSSLLACALELSPGTIMADAPRPACRCTAGGMPANARVTALRAGLRFTAEAVIETTLIACLHSLGTVQARAALQMKSHARIP